MKEENNTQLRFEYGDWVVYDGWVCRITDVKEDGYCNSAREFIPKEREDNMHLWTIADAKEGDILVWDRRFIGIVEKITDDHLYFYCSCNQHDMSFSTSDYYKKFNIGRFSILPATDREINLLKQKMSENNFNLEEAKKRKTAPEQKDPYMIPEEIYITKDINGQCNIFFDEPSLEEDGVFRSPNGCWCDISLIRWDTKNLQPGDCLKFRIQNSNQ